MQIRDVVELSRQRSERWMGDEQWTVLEWAGAMCGEAGETANAAKKLRRIQQSLKNVNKVSGRQVDSERAAKMMMAKEAADTFLYLVLCWDAAGFSGPEVEEIIADVFNKKSEECDFPERLEGGAREHPCSD